MGDTAGMLYDLGIWAVVTLVPLAFVAWAAREAWRLVAPAYYIARGDYTRGRDHSIALHDSWWRRAPGVELSASYNAALCDLNEGKLEEALARLTAVVLEDLDDNLHYAYASATGICLVLLERDPKKAVSVLEDSVALRRTDADLLALAHARWQAGSFPEARAAFDEAEASPASAGPKLGKKTLFWRDKVTHAAQVDLLRGWYYVRLARFDDARGALSRASVSPLDNVYRRRAQALLEKVRTGTTHDDEEAPSSLRPMVVP